MKMLTLGAIQTLLKPKFKNDSAKMKGLPINDEIHYILHNINICLYFYSLKLTTKAFLIYES